MASLPVDNLKSEKAEAFNSYRRQQKMKQVMHLFNILLALFLFCRSSLLPIIVEFCSFFYGGTISFLSNSVYVFIIGNAIIVFIYILTLQDGNRTSVTDVLYHPHFSLNSNAASTGDVHALFGLDSVKSLLKTDSEGETLEPTDKQIVLTAFPPEKQGGSISDKCLKEGLSTAETDTPKVVHAESMDVKEKVTETTMTTLRTVTSKTGGEKVSEVNGNYRRIQSENYERRVVVKHGRGGQLQRMKTENLSRSQSQRQLVKYRNGPNAETQTQTQTERRLRSMEDMSNEEFNRTIEDFIAKQKKKQREELQKTSMLGFHSGLSVEVQ